MPKVSIPDYPYGHPKDEDSQYDKWRQKEDEMTLREEIRKLAKLAKHWRGDICERPTVREVESAALAPSKQEKLTE